MRKVSIPRSLETRCHTLVGNDVDGGDDSGDGGGGDHNVDGDGEMVIHKQMEFTQKILHIKGYMVELKIQLAESSRKKN